MPRPNFEGVLYLKVKIRNFMFNFYFLKFLWWQVTILWSHWCSLFQTLVDSACGFQSQGGSIIACALLSLACNDPQSQLWISRPRPVLILHLGMVRLLLEWPPNVTSGITGRGRIRTQDLAAQCPAGALSTELSRPAFPFNFSSIYMRKWGKCYTKYNFCYFGLHLVCYLPKEGHVTVL